MKKKRIYSSLLAMSLILGAAPSIGEANPCYGAEKTSDLYVQISDSNTASGSDTSDSENTETADAINLPQLTETKKLSLEEAVKIMQTTGSNAETALLHKESDIAVSKGYSETVQKIKKAEDSLDSAFNTLGSIPAGYGDAVANQMGYYNYNALMSAVMDKAYDAQLAGATSNNKKIMKLRRNFANENIENNYQAEMNQIEADTISIYYKVLLAQEQLDIAKENVELQQKTLKNVQAKKNAGMLSKKDVYQAQSALTDAQSTLRSAETTLKYAKMSFNYLLGYNVMQEVVFTDTIEAVTNKTEAAGVEEAVANALENRLELKGAGLAVDVYEILLADVSNYPKSSSTYLNAKINLSEAEKTQKDAYSQLEIDVRNKYNTLQDKKAAVEAAEKLLAYAVEGERLVNLTYEEGLSTVDELLSTQVSLYKAKLNLANANSDYALALKAYEYAQGIGTTRLPL